ncbi:MAG: metal dependent phosphohydrolase [Crocinitomicaceae bacterium]|jgi:HD superfamily phosphohydrolase|nr:metal dependent phosphohydrolase [Crocinitomicaceae bacterium]
MINTNNKKKIFNDPVYGFVSIPDEFIFDLIEHPYFQRLRRISQLGLTHLVYPGALHTRFHHVLGAMHLMTLAVATIRRKGHEITPEEERAVLCAILLHDIGHGPFSHALEHDIVNHVSHEDISAFFIDRLSHEFDGKLDLTLKIFRNEYHKKPFLYQLVSSQLDMDRMDYLNRDSFFTGVAEGQIGSDRIIEMLNVHKGNLVIEEKGIYSIEKFLVSRRFMYWQVYLHKTVVAAEFMLINILRRAKKIVAEGKELFASPALKFFLENDITTEDFKSDPKVLETFAKLDDFDITSAVKVWQDSDDKVLGLLSRKLINRELLKVEVSKTPIADSSLSAKRHVVRNKYKLTEDEAAYFVYSEVLTNNAYNQNKQNINLLLKNGEILEVSQASDNLNISALATPVEKYCFCYPA